MKQVIIKGEIKTVTTRAAEIMVAKGEADYYEIQQKEEKAEIKTKEEKKSRKTKK